MHLCLCSAPEVFVLLHIAIWLWSQACRLNMHLVEKCSYSAPSLKESPTVGRRIRAHTHGLIFWIMLIWHLFRVATFTRGSGMRGKQSKSKVNWVSLNFQIMPIRIDYRMSVGKISILKGDDFLQARDLLNYELLDRSSCWLSCWLET